MTLDLPSLISQHFAGVFPPTPEFASLPYGIDVSYTLSNTENIFNCRRFHHSKFLLSSLYWILLRLWALELEFWIIFLHKRLAKIISIFSSRPKICLTYKGVMFQFESSRSLLGLQHFLEQICYEIGFPTQNLHMCIYLKSTISGVDLL